MLSEIAAVLATNRLNELGPGTPNLAMRAPLKEVEQALATQVRDADFAQACYAGLWLLHDFHEESHAISQELSTLEGSWWHGMLHRREPDYWNAKYWFRRVPAHPLYPTLGAEAAALVREAGMPNGSGGLLRQSTWDAALFSDLCEKAANGPEDLALLCRRIQRREWDLLFSYCYERAFDLETSTAG